MILTKEQAEKRLNSPTNLANQLKEFRDRQKQSVDAGVLTINSTRRKLPKLPNEAKQDIVERIESGLETQQEIAQDYGVSHSAISRVKRELTKAQAEDDLLEPKASLLSGITQEAKSRAIDKMMLALGLITEEKLAESKIKDLAAATSAAARVYSALTEKTGLQAPAVNLVIYSPEIRDERNFKVVEIGTPSGDGLIKEK